jgi:hypothetical protein
MILCLLPEPDAEVQAKQEVVGKKNRLSLVEQSCQGSTHFTFVGRICESNEKIALLNFRPHHKDASFGCTSIVARFCH